MNTETKRKEHQPPPMRKRKSMRFFNFFTASSFMGTSTLAEPEVADEDFKLTRLQNIQDSE